MPSLENADTIEEILSEESLARVADDLRRLIRPTLRLQITEATVEETIPIGTTKIGGLPDLPAEAPWPEVNGVPLSFVAQIRLADTSGLLPDSPLPEDGILFFFYSAYFDCRVLYVTEGTVLSRRAAPTDAMVFPVYDVTAFLPALLLPRVETCYITTEREQRTAVITLTPDEWDFYADATHSSVIPNIDHLLGYSQDGQPYAMEGSYIDFRSKLFPELPDWNTLSPAERQQEKEGCQLLLQIEPKDFPMHFGRAGAVFYFIRRVDLERRAFDRTWAWVQ